MGNILGWFAGTFGFVTSNFQLLTYAAGGITILVLGLTVFNYIDTNAKNQVLIEQYKKNQDVLQQALKDKDAQLQFKDDQLALANDAQTNLKEKLDKLQTRYDNINTDQLGQGINDAAPDALKNLIREMNKHR